MSSKHKHGHEEHESDERWLITYADMITLLMVFFIVLFSMANTDLKKFAQVAESMQIAFNVLSIGSKPGSSLIGKANQGSASRPSPAFFQTLPPRQRDFVSVTSELTAFASEAGLEGDISVNMNLEGVIISLSNALIFESGRAELRPESLQTLHKVAEILKTIHNPVRIEGHTDNLPTNDPRYPTNWELSVARAVRIVHYLVEEEDIAPDRLLAAGQAEFNPVALNDNRENRALNRRADIIIIYPNDAHSISVESPASQAYQAESTPESSPSPEPGVLEGATQPDAQQQ